MPRYTDDSRERVRDAVDFVAVVGARTELRKAGVRRYEGLCPFHDERTPSFGIDPVEKLYHCFGCGAGGDVFSFVMETENLGFGEALELLADRAGVELEPVEEDPRDAQKRGRRDRLLALLERTAAFYVRMLWESPEAEGARQYLRDRGLEEPVAREFRVGYSPAGWDRVVSGSMKAGFSVDELLAAGLGQRSRGRSGVIDRFRGRLMFPWADARGRVLGFGARALDPEDKPKYLNTAEGELFHKGRQVYGADLARVAAAKAGSVVLVEGYTDVIALHQAGLRHVVGSMGTAVTEDQGKELAKLSGTVQLALDADAAGQAAMLKASAALKRADERLVLRVVPLPTGTDPADVVQREGAEAVQALIARSVPFARWQVEHALDHGDRETPEGRDALLAAVRDPIRALPQSVLREDLVRLVAGRLGLSEGLIASALSGSDAAPVAPRPRGGDRLADPGPEAGGRFAGASAALDHFAQAEHAFLALCIAMPSEGARRLADPAVETLLQTPLSLRAAAHLRAHLHAPSQGLDPDDAALARLIASLVVRAGAIADPTVVELERATLMLQMVHVDRSIAAARVAAQPVSELAAEKQRLRLEYGRLSA